MPRRTGTIWIVPDRLDGVDAGGISGASIGLHRNRKHVLALFRGQVHLGVHARDQQSVGLRTSTSVFMVRVD